MAQPQLQVRISQAILDELNALVPLVQEHPNFRTGRVTLQDVARLALSRGIEQLKRELGQESQG
jgi:Cu/Ag efflux pump CusA